AVVHGDLQMPLEVVRADVVDPPLRRPDRVVREDPAPHGPGLPARGAGAGSQRPPLGAQPPLHGAAVGDPVRPVRAQCMTNRCGPHSWALTFSLGGWWLPLAGGFRWLVVSAGSWLPSNPTATAAGLSRACRTCAPGRQDRSRGRGASPGTGSGQG